MNKKFQRDAQYVNGVRTAQNYIDECVLRSNTDGSDVLLHFMKTLDHEALRGFVETIHDWMQCEATE